MSTTLSNGYKLPVDGDKGASLFDDLEFNFSRLNDHSHDGTDSDKLSTESFLPSSQVISAANWQAWQNGIYRQTINAIGGLTVNEHGMTFRDSNGKIYYLDTETIADAQYYVYSNDPTLEVTVVYN